MKEGGSGRRIVEPGYLGMPFYSKIKARPALPPDPPQAHALHRLLGTKQDPSHAGGNMHWLEGILIIGAGFFAFLIGAGRFPGDSQKRQSLEVRMPWVKNRILMYGMAGFLWAFGFAAVLGLVK